MGEQNTKEEASKQESKVEETKDNNEESKPTSPSIVLSMHLHCSGCTEKIERIILKMKGVEGVVIDFATNQLSIKGVVEPQSMCDRIEKKTKRKVQILSPLRESESKVQPTQVQEPKVQSTQVSGLKTMELQVNMHCEACAAQLKKMILKMKGVTSVETELNTGKVTVTGTMEENKVVDYVYKRTKKQAKVVPQPEPEPEKSNQPEPKPEPEPEEEKEEEKEEASADEEKPLEKSEGGKKGGEPEAMAVVEMINGEDEQQSNNIQRIMHYSIYEPIYFKERVPPPQLFSDENPNACCIS